MYGKCHVVAYLLLGPGQLALKLLLLIEKSLVLSAQRCETFRQLISELPGILLRLIAHRCVSLGKSGGVAVSLCGETSSDCAAKRLRCHAKEESADVTAGLRKRVPSAAPKRERPIR